MWGWFLLGADSRKLTAGFLVGAEGFEPTTLCSQSRCATRLRYAPTSSIVTYLLLKSAIAAHTHLLRPSPGLGREFILE
jgi:hypothetical protein